MKRLILMFTLLLVLCQPMAAQVSPQTATEDTTIHAQTRGLINSIIHILSPLPIPPFINVPDPSLGTILTGIDYVSSGHGNVSENFAKSFTVYYDSYDGQKNKIKLSARVYYDSRNEPDNILRSPIKRILLNCHPTVTDDERAPSGARPLDAEVARMVGLDHHSTLVVCPDYCGYGLTTHVQHPYLIHDVTARNCVDAVIAAIREARNLGLVIDGMEVDTDIVGYSQGGATALACAKYLESDACPEEIKKVIHLHQTACGDGPYSAKATVEQYMEWGDPTRPDHGLDLEYPCVLPLIVAAAKDAYNDGCMRTVNIEDYFSKEFLASGVLEYLKTKNLGTDELNEKIKEAMPERRRPVDIMSEELIDKQTGKFKEGSHLYKCLMRAMELADLSQGWTPTKPIYFYHLKSDKVVPYSNFEAVKKGIMKNNPNVQFVEPSDAHASVNLILRVAKGMVSPDYSHTDHSGGGFLFYMDYMLGDRLRSNKF